MISLHDLLIHYLEEKISNNNNPALQEVLNCIIIGEDDQLCVDEFGDEDIKIDYEQLKQYYQTNKTSLDDEYNIICSYAIYNYISNATTNSALEIIKEAAGSNSVKDFCDNHFDTFLSSDNTVLEKYAFSQFKTEIEQRKIVSMIYAIMKYHKKNGTTN